MADEETLGKVRRLMDAAFDSLYARYQRESTGFQGLREMANREVEKSDVVLAELIDEIVPKDV